MLAAVRLGIFEALRERALAAEALAEHLQMDTRATAALLTALVDLGYAREDHGAYSNSPMTTKWMLKQSGNFAPGFEFWASNTYQLTDNLEDSVRAGTSSVNLYEWIENQPQASRDFQEGTEGHRMKPRITVITLGVDDLPKAVRFYRDGLGLPTDGIIGTEFEYGAVAFFDLQAGLKLALWPRTSIAHDTGIAPGKPNATDFTIGHNVSSKAKVDAVMEQAQGAGAVVVQRAHDTFWGGYSGYFQDPDGHLWEVTWNPEWSDQEGA